MKLTKYEQETIVLSNAAEQTSTIYTSDPNMIRKLDKLVTRFPEVYKVTKQDDISKTYECASKKYTNCFRGPRNFSEKQRTAALKNLDKANKTKK